MEWTIVILIWVFYLSDTDGIYFYSGLVGAAIVIDMYFCYAVYSCYKLGARGELRVEISQAFGNNASRVTPNINEIQIIGFGSNQDAFQMKEITAYPHDNTRNYEPVLELPLHDFTKN